MLALTGSTGELGGRVAARLAERGVPQVLIVRDPARAPRLDLSETRQIESYRDGAGLREALRDVDDLYFVSAEESEDRLEQHLNVVEAAREAGVRRIAYVSYMRAAADCTFTLGRQHYATEEAIRDTGLAFTFLRSSFYADFMPYFASPGGVIRGPAGDGRFPPVSRDDLADAAVAVLTGGDAHHGETCELSGPVLLTMAEVAERLSDYTGRDIGYEEETIEEAWESRRPSGAPDWQLDAWVSTYVAIANGELDFESDAVERLTGHRPQTLEECLRAHPELLAPLDS